MQLISLVISLRTLLQRGLCDRIEIQLSYAIGVKDPTSVHVDTYGTGKVADEVILDAIKKEFDLTPQGIINTLDLLNPIYGPTAAMDTLVVLMLNSHGKN